MLRINDRSDTAQLLRLGDSVDSQRRLTRRLWAKDLNDTSTRVAPDTESYVKRQAPRGDHTHILHGIIRHIHDSALAKLLLYTSHGSLQRLHFRCDICNRRSDDSPLIFLCHIYLVLS